MSDKLLPIIIVGAIAGFAGYEYYMANSSPGSEGVFQGYIEGEFVLLGAEQSGRILRLDPAEGSSIKKGDLLFSLDEHLAKARLAETSAALATAAAGLDNLKDAQQRPEKIAILQATRKRLKAELDLAIIELRRQEDLYRRKVTSKEHFDQARTEFLKAKAARDEIDRQIAFAKLPARRGLIAAAKARLDIARAAREQALILLQKRKTHAPAAGRVQQIFFREGEIIAAGQPVLSLLPPDSLKALFFVPENQRSSLNAGLKLQITCDGCPDNLFARVSFISLQAEYTPPVIFSPETRTKQVFRVEARLDPGAGFLAPGQPVTVILLKRQAE